MYTIILIYREKVVNVVMLGEMLSACIRKKNIFCVNVSSNQLEGVRMLHPIENFTKVYGWMCCSLNIYSYGDDNTFVVSGNHFSQPPHEKIFS